MIAIPFHPDHSTNAEKCKDGATPCIICGKGIKDDKQRYSVHVHNGGSDIVTEEESAKLDPSADLLFYPIGVNCLRNHPELSPYVHDSKPKKAKAKMDWQALYFDLYRQMNGENTPDGEIMADATKRAEILSYRK